MNDKVKILGFAGSLRKASYNRGLLRAAVELAPPEVEVESFDLDGIPLYNQDLEVDMPQRVSLFKERILAADAILIVTPEYNYSMPGVLKNAIDWASRPYGENAFDGKAAGIMGATVGMVGTARAQYHLRQCCVYVNMYPLNQPEIMVPYAKQNFDEQGNLTDQKARDKIVDLLHALASWSHTIKHAGKEVHA